MRDIQTVLEHLRADQRPALTFYQGGARASRLTAHELLVRVEAMAEALAGRGVKRGDCVAVLAANELAVPVLMLALLRLGAVAVPLPPRADERDWRFMLEDVGAQLLVCAKSLEERAESVRQVVPDFVGLDVLFDASHAAAATHERSAAPDDLSDAPALILYTSGTTGGSKGVVLTQRAILGNAMAMAARLELRGATQLAVLPLHHAHALGFGLMSSLVSRGHLVFTDGLDPFHWQALIAAEQVEITSVVPHMLKLLSAAQVKRERVPSLRCMLVSSAPLSASAARSFEASTGIALVQGWGLSEFTNFAACVRHEAPDRQRLLGEGPDSCVGPALDGVEIRVVRDDGITATEGERGELQIKGPCTMLGYHNQPELTARALNDGWLCTGDLGYFLMEHGEPHYFVTGRLKEIVIRAGDKYAPADIERKLFEGLPAPMPELCVLGIPHSLLGEEVVAYLAEAQPDPALLEALREAIDALPAPERPKLVLHGAAPIPRTHTGKIQRQKLAHMFGKRKLFSGPVQFAALEPTSPVLPMRELPPPDPIPPRSRRI